MTIDLIGANMSAFNKNEMGNNLYFQIQLDKRRREIKKRTRLNIRRKNG